MKILNMKKITHCLKTTVTLRQYYLLSEGWFCCQNRQSGLVQQEHTELLINPFSRTSGWGNRKCCRSSWFEGQYSNVAGLAN